jgi:hypothetical protein
MGLFTPTPTEDLSDEATGALQVLENNTQSSAVSVAEHLKTVASNSEEQASDDHLVAEAENLQEAAQFFIDRVTNDD